ncbi:phage tail sheath subtilisin-like domain-containing protein [Phenylobacterium sp.]|uniref:phage tail sheath subtilisin-like domain-containing protein n=1 Tax=Phenylobacterium sp. TaxID=1871053 RepID=UPI0035AEC353
MSISFNTIPQALRVPLFYAEVDNSKAGDSVDNPRALIVAQMLAAGDADADTPIQVAGADEAKTRFGVGSLAALMVAWYRKRDVAGELWVLPLADDDAAVAATGKLSFTGTATAAGVLSLYVGGELVSVAVTSGMTAAQLAAAAAAAITAASDLPVTAAVNGVNAYEVDITARNKGLAGDDIDLRVNYLGARNGQAVPAGITLTITAMSGGATNPTLTTGLAALGDERFDCIVSAYTDTTSLDALKALLGDAAGRWSWESQVYGHVFAAYRGTVAARTTFGNARNDQHAAVMGFYDSPTPAWLWAANVAGAAFVSLKADPARPLQTLELDVLAPPIASRDTLAQRNTLLFDGISTYTVGPDGTCRIENLITTYQTNAFGQPDDSYLQVETLFTLAALLRALKGAITSKYSRVKLADNGTRVPPGSAVVTPNMIRAELIAQYRAVEGDLVENADAFADALIVERNAANRNRVDVLWPADLINGLRVFALLAQFRS